MSRPSVFDDVINVNVHSELKQQLKALSLAKQLGGFSPLVRSILQNGLQAVLNNMTEAERETYSKLLEIEKLKANQLKGSEVNE